MEGAERRPQTATTHRGSGFCKTTFWDVELRQILRDVPGDLVRAATADVDNSATGYGLPCTRKLVLWNVPTQAERVQVGMPSALANGRFDYIQTTGNGFLPDTAGAKLPKCLHQTVDLCSEFY